MRRFEYWTIAYRAMGEKLLIENTKDPFVVIPNTWRFWCADPHLLEQQGRTWVFAELYDRLLRKGVIGCCELTEKGATPWQVVLQMPWHLSYPHVFEDNGQIYMIPESYVGHEIALYRAVDFPTNWEKVEVLKSNFVAVDSTRFEANGTTWLMTLQLDEGHEDLKLYPYEDLTGDGYLISQDDANKRPGGKLFLRNGDLIRPAQDCTESYGCALNFYKIERVEEKNFVESLILKINSCDIVTDYKGIPKGIHTYNFSSHYEVVDLKDYEIDPLFYFMRPIHYIIRHLKGIMKR